MHLKIEGYSLSLLRILDHIEESKKGKEADVEEGRNIKQQVDMYEAAKQAIEEQRRKVSLSFLTGLRKGSFGNSLVIKGQNYHYNVHEVLYLLTFVILIMLENYNYRRLKLFKKRF